MDGQVVSEEVREQPARERQCVHRGENTPGRIYRGDSYVSALQRLRSSAAMKMASKVGAFFWSDAPRVRVWLCRDCAREVGLDR